MNAPADRPCRIWHEHDSTIDEIAFAVCNHYTLQGEALSLAILQDQPVRTPLADALANMQVIAAIVRSGREHSRVPSSPA